MLFFHPHRSWKYRMELESRQITVGCCLICPPSLLVNQWPLLFDYSYTSIPWWTLLDHTFLVCLWGAWNVSKAFSSQETDKTFLFCGSRLAITSIVVAYPNSLILIWEGGITSSARNDWIQRKASFSGRQKFEFEKGQWKGKLKKNI